jgi:single-strand DNA-binding protein
MNQFTGIGRMVRDPEFQFTPQGTAVCKFTIAINRRFQREETDFIDCVAWKSLAENVANFTAKGSLVAVQGSLQIRKWEKDGNKRSAPEINCDQVEFLDRKKDSAPKETASSGWDSLGA